MALWGETWGRRAGLLIHLLSNHRQHCCKRQKNSRFLLPAMRGAPVLTLINTIFLKGWQNVNHADFMSGVSCQPSYTNVSHCFSAFIFKIEENLSLNSPPQRQVLSLLSVTFFIWQFHTDLYYVLMVIGSSLCYLPSSPSALIPTKPLAKFMSFFISHWVQLEVFEWPRVSNSRLEPGGLITGLTTEANYSPVHQEPLEADSLAGKHMVPWTPAPSKTSH